MAEVKSITYKVEIDGTEVTKELKSIEDYSKRLVNLKEDFEKQPIGSDKYKKLQQEIKKTEKGLRVAETANEGFLDSMASTPGIIGVVGQSLKGVGDTFSTMKGKALQFASAVGGKATGGLKLFKVALASTGIGLLVVALGSLISYFTQTEKGTRVIKVAMEAMGIVVGNIVGYFAELGEKMVSAFSNPKQALLDLGNAIKENIVNRVMGLLELLPMMGKAISLAFSGEFSEAAKVAGDAIGKVVLGVENVTDKVTDMVTTLVDETVKAVKAGDNIVGLERKIRDAQQALVVRNAVLKKQLEEQRKIVDDTTRSYDERKTALEQVEKLNNERANNIVKEASLTEQLLKQQIKLESNYEARETLETELANATAARITAEQEASVIKLEAGQKGREIDEGELARKMAINDMIKQNNLSEIEGAYSKQEAELQIARDTAEEQLRILKATEEEKLLIKMFYDGLEAELEAEKQAKIKEILDVKELTKEEKDILAIETKREKDLTDLEDLGATEEQKKQVITKAEGDIVKVKEASAKASQKIKEIELNNNLNAAKGALSSIASALGEQSAVGKAAAIASTTIDTYQAAVAAYKSVVGVPIVGPGLAIAAAAAAVAGGIANVKKIISTKTPGGKGGGGAPPTAIPFRGGGVVGQTADTQPDLNFNTQQATSDITDVQPVRAFVVSNDVSNQQQLDRQAQSRSTL